MTTRRDSSTTTMAADGARASVAPGYTPCECAASFSNSIATWTHAGALPPGSSPLSPSFLPQIYDYGDSLHEHGIACWLSRDPLFEIAHRVAYENEHFRRLSSTAHTGGARPTVLKYQVILHSLDLVEILADEWGHRPDTRLFPNAKVASPMLADDYRRKRILRRIPEQDVAETSVRTADIGGRSCRNRGASAGADRHAALGIWHLLPGKGLQQSIGRSSTPADSAADPRKHLPRPPQMRGGREYQAFNANPVSHVDLLGLQALCEWNCFGTQRIQCDDRGCGNQNGQYALGCNLDCNCSGTMTITIP